MRMNHEFIAEMAAKYPEELVAVLQAVCSPDNEYDDEEEGRLVQLYGFTDIDRNHGVVVMSNSSGDYDVEHFSYFSDAQQRFDEIVEEWTPKDEDDDDEDDDEDDDDDLDDLLDDGDDGDDD